jgi:hypothetical protein
MDIHLVPSCIITGVKMYILTTASDRIVDTLEFFPHNYKMPQLSSNDRLLMAAKEMMDVLQNPHSEVPFASVWDDTIKALADLAATFKLKLQHAPSPVTQASPVTIIQRPNLIPFPALISASPMPNKRQTRSKTTIHTPNIPDRPLPPRVVSPRTLHHSPPRVSNGSLELMPRNSAHVLEIDLQVDCCDVAIGLEEMVQHISC